MTQYQTLPTPEAIYKWANNIPYKRFDSHTIMVQKDGLYYYFTLERDGLWVNKMNSITPLSGE